MEIIELNEKFVEQTKDLLVELQEYVCEIDKYKLNIISPDYREKYFLYMIEDIKNNDGKIYLAIENNIVYGFIAGFMAQYEDKDKLDYSCPNKGIVAELIVSKKYRKGGTGNLLLSKMEDYLKSIGCEYVSIDVFAYNEIGKSFYEKYDYEYRMITMFKKLN